MANPVTSRSVAKSYDNEEKDKRVSCCNNFWQHLKIFNESASAKLGHGAWGTILVIISLAVLFFMGYSLYQTIDTWDLPLQSDMDLIYCATTSVTILGVPLFFPACGLIAGLASLRVALCHPADPEVTLD